MSQVETKDFLNQLLTGNGKGKYGSWYFGETLFKPKRCHSDYKWYGSSQNLIELLEKIHFRFVDNTNDEDLNLFVMKSKSGRGDVYDWFGKIRDILEDDKVGEFWTEEEISKKRDVDSFLKWKYNTSFSISKKYWDKFLEEVLVPTFMDTYEKIDESTVLNKPLSKKEILRNLFAGDLEDMYSDLHYPNASVFGRERNRNGLYYSAFGGNNMLEIGSHIYNYIKKVGMLTPVKEIDGVKVLSDCWSHEVFTIMEKDEDLRDKIWGDYDNFYRTFNSYFSIGVVHWEEFFEKVLYPVFDKYFKYN